MKLSAALLKIKKLLKLQKILPIWNTKPLYIIFHNFSSSFIKTGWLEWDI